MFIIRLLGKLPLGVLYLLSSLLSVVLYYVAGYRKKTVRENIRNSFPEKTEEEVRSLTREFYTRFTDYAVETLKVLDMNDNQLTERVEVEYDEQLQRDIMDRQSVVLLTSHQFNWEWALHATKLHMNFPFEVAYQRLQNKAFEKYMNESRTHFGAILIEKSVIVKHTISTRSDFKALTLLADQRPVRKGQKYWTTFLHQDTPFVMGPEILTQAMNAPTYLHDVERVRRGHYKVRISSLTRPPYEKGSHEILEAYVKGLEKVIRKDPAGYLWSHKRWKFSRESD